jgi:hypothetical protein
MGDLAHQGPTGAAQGFPGMRRQQFVDRVVDRRSTTTIGVGAGPTASSSHNLRLSELAADVVAPGVVIAAVPATPVTQPRPRP